MKWIFRNLQVDCYSQGLLKSNLSEKMWTPQPGSDQYLYWNVKGHQASPVARRLVSANFSLAAYLAAKHS